jgi:hypothetical protein
MKTSDLAVVKVDNFSSMWQRATRAQFSQRRQVDEESAYCPAAQEFSTWVERHILSVKGDADVVAAKKHQDEGTIGRAKRAVNQAKLHLGDAYWRFYFPLPASHQTHVGNRGHLCIFHVYKQAWLELDQLLRSIAPPPLVLVETRTVVREKVIEKPVTKLHLGDEEFSL